ncbi:MAG TPA: DUF1761 domain-containing protein [Rhizomicrobium sp.]|jgi:hypothetical protein|nr:DUF1761 domain-containing protein [Rhizomicrobium sp.]
MSWVIPVAVLIAGVLASFTDWYFMGVLHHERYMTYPDTWWPRDRGGETRPILYSASLGFVTAAAVVALCAMVGVGDVWGGLKVACIAWFAGPLVQVATTQLWIRIDWRVSMAHALGYLARFVIAGVAAGIALPLG